MRYLSVCSGIEAASVAWAPLGWRAAAFAEIEPFPSRVLAARFPGVPNLGDMNGFRSWPAQIGGGPVDLLVGGTPCQSFSIAGLRAGLDDPRGSLLLVYLAIAERYWPRWVVWENVPGVLSVDDGRAFGSLLGGLAKLGYGFAYRVLDAQFIRVDGYARAVPQRRNRVFVVGYLGGDWRRAAAVLFEREGMSGNPPPRREAGQGVAVFPTLGAGGNRTGGDRPPGTSVDTAESLIVADGSGDSAAVSAKWAKGSGGPAGDEAYNLVAHALRARHNLAHQADRDTPLVPVAFDCKAGANTGFAIGEVPVALRGEGHGGGHAAVAFDLRGRAGGAMPEGPHETANIRAASGGSSRSYVATGDVYPTLSAHEGGTLTQIPPIPVSSGGAWAVRRLTPVECERLQGFPDGWTDVGNGRGGPTPDGPRYRALGNSMACNVMRWIGMRIALVDRIAAEMEREAA